MKMLTILKAFYSDKVFCKVVVDLNNKVIKDNVEVVI